MGGWTQLRGAGAQGGLCSLPPRLPEQGGQDISLARMMGAAWGKEGNLKLPKVRVLVRNEVFPPIQILAALFPHRVATADHGSGVLIPLPLHPVSRRW